MKIAILCESSADRAALRILVDAIVGRRTDYSSDSAIGSHGYHSVRNTIEAIIKATHFGSDVDGLIVVVDSNGSEIHSADHDDPGMFQDRCRLCRLEFTAQNVLRGLRLPTHRQQPLRIALGIAVPCIEAWYRCGIDPQVTEANWNVGPSGRTQLYYKNDLKRAVYGSDRAGLQMMTECAKREATRLSTCMDQLRAAFPNGFGPLFDELIKWTA